MAPNNKTKTVKNSATTETAAGITPDPLPIVTPDPAPVQQKFYLIEEKAINILLTDIAKLPWSSANPLIMFIRENVKEINTSVSKPGNGSN